MDNGQLICLYLLARLLQRELEKCLRLVTFLPMQDMDKHFGLGERRDNKNVKSGQLIYFSDSKARKPGVGGGIGTMLTQVEAFGLTSSHKRSFENIFQNIQVSWEMLIKVLFL